jgi:endonuclease III
MQFALPLTERPIVPQIRARLLARSGAQRDAWRLDPVSQLINSMVSSRTLDAISQQAFVRLRHCYPSWELLSRAIPSEIEPIIRSVTFAERKAVYLPLALRMIMARTGSLDLHFLAEWDEEMALHWLRGLPGVGAKIAAAVLNFSTLRKRTLVVDTHLLRLGKRLGLLPRSGRYETGYEGYMPLIPDDWDGDDLYEFHWLMKYHGQRICTHDAPDCTRCTLRDICPSRASEHSISGNALERVKGIEPSS